MHKTELLYMNDFDVETAQATVVAALASDGRFDVQLSQTCFYPRGGGQDYDQGIITKGEVVFNVAEVRLDEQGVVHHFGTFRSGSFTDGNEVELHVDSIRRKLNTRLHSAGHLVDMAVDALGYDWVPGKGAHYPHMSFVEYSGALAPEEYAKVQREIEAKVSTFIKKGGENEIRFMPKEQMHDVCRHVPDYIPENKPARVVIYNGTFGVPCGGTHVRNLSEIGRVHITKIKCKKGVVKVSYSL